MTADRARISTATRADDGLATGVKKLMASGVVAHNGIFSVVMARLTE